MKALAKIYKFRQEGSNQKYAVSIPGSYNEGKRWFRRFNNKAEAEEFVDEFSRDPFGVIARLKGVNTGTEQAPLRGTDKQAAEYLFGYMQQRLGTSSISVGIKALDYYFDAFLAFKQISLANAVQEYFEHRSRLAIKAETQTEAKRRLRRLVDSFGPSLLSTITTADLRKFFFDIPLGEDGKASNRISYHMRISPFFTWAHKEAKYLKENPFAPIKKDDLGEMGVNKEYYTVEQFERMLQIAQAEFPDTLLPLFVVCGFAGLRSCEATRDRDGADALRWSDLHFDAEEPFIHVRPEVVKYEKEEFQRHISAPWAIEAVRSWLAFVPSPKGEFVCPTRSQIAKARARFKQLSGTELHENGLRNSFGTYGRAMYKGSFDLISGQMGNTAEIARQHYATSLPAGRGPAFFGLRPFEVIEKAA